MKGTTLDYDVSLDSIDWALLEQLRQDARLSWVELGKRVGLTPPAIALRVARLEEQGVITGYRAQVDLARIGRPTIAFLRVRVGAERRLDRIRSVFEKIPEILECHRVTGDDCYLVKVAVAGTPELESLVDRLMLIGDPITLIVLSTFIGESSPRPLQIE